MRSDFDVDGYEIEGLLGAGATGETWLARDDSAGIQVALHRIQPRDSKAPEDARRLVERLAALDHPHIRRIRELLTYDDELVFVLDHLEGGSLEQLLLVRGTLDPGELVTAAATVAGALSAAHERDLVHGALTPDAILFTATGSPIVTDIGFGRLTAADASSPAAYADPAEPDGSDPSPAGDVYSLAAICYTALTGLVPRAGEAHRPVHQVAPGVPPGLAHAIQAGLQQAWDMRPNMSQFGALLDAASRRVPVRLPDARRQTDRPGGSGGQADPGGPTELSRSGQPPVTPVPWSTSPQPSASGPAAVGPAEPAGSGPTFSGAGVGGAGAGVSDQEPGPSGAGAQGGGGSPDAGAESGVVQRHGSGPSAAPPTEPDQDQSARSEPAWSEYSARSIRAAGQGGGGRSGQAGPAPSADPDSGDSGRPDTGIDDRSDPDTPSKAMLAIIGAALLVVVAIVVVVVTWRLSSGTPEAKESKAPRPSHTSSPIPTRSLDPFSARWNRRLAVFDQRRAIAYAHRDPHRLNLLYAPNSQAYKENAEEMRQLQKDKVAKVLRLHQPISALAPVTKEAHRIVFEVVRRQESYTLVMGDGQRGRCPAGPEKKVRIEVVPLEGSTAWRISREWQVGGPTTPDIVVCTRTPAG